MPKITGLFSGMHYFAYTHCHHFPSERREVFDCHSRQKYRTGLCCVPLDSIAQCIPG
jgi:hypothetical protein